MSKELEVGFDPWRGKSFKIRVPLPILASGRLSEGAKLLYGLLVFHLGKPDRPKRVCNPSLNLLARELAVSTDTVLRWMKELVDNKYIQRERAGSGRPSRCTFLPPPESTSSDSAELPIQDSAELQGLDTAELQSQENTDTAEMRPVKPQNCGSDTAELQVAYKEETIHETIHETKSSSSSGSSGARERSEEEDDSRLEFGRWMQQVTGAKVPPSDAEIAEVLSRCPGWTGADAKRALLKLDAREFEPKLYSGFRKPMATVFERFNGKPPVNAQRKTPPQTLPSEQELAASMSNQRAVEADTEAFDRLVENLPKAVRDELKIFDIGSFWASERATILENLRERPPSQVCKKCHCIGIDMKQQTPSGPMRCECQFRGAHQQAGREASVVLQ